MLSVSQQLVIGLMIGHVNQRASFRLHAEAEGQSGVIQMHVRYLHLANTYISSEFLEVQARHLVIKCDWKVIAVHLSGEEFLQAAVRTVQTINIHSIARAICRLKKRKTLDVVPMSMTNKQVHF